MSHSGSNASSMPTGGTVNSCLRVLGEEENELYNQKHVERVHPATTHSLDFGDKKFSSIGPKATLSGSSSLATVSNNTQSDAITKATCISDPVTNSAADSISDDTGSEGDSRMNSDREPLLEN